MRSQWKPRLVKKGAERRRKKVRQDAPSTKLKRRSKFEGNRYSSAVRFALLDLDWGDASQTASQPARGWEGGPAPAGVATVRNVQVP